MRTVTTGRFEHDWESAVVGTGLGRIVNIPLRVDSVDSEVPRESPGGHGLREASGLGGRKDRRASQRSGGGRRRGRTVCEVCVRGWGPRPPSRVVRLRRKELSHSSFPERKVRRLSERR